jgi:hypothetical protein
VSKPRRLKAAQDALERCDKLTALLGAVEDISGAYALKKLGITTAKNDELLWRLWTRARSWMYMAGDVTKKQARAGKKLDDVDELAAQAVAKVMTDLGRCHEINRIGTYIDDLMRSPVSFIDTMNELDFVARNAEHIDEVQAAATHLHGKHYVKGVDVITKTDRQIELKFWNWKNAIYGNLEVIPRMVERVVKQLKSRAKDGDVTRIEVRFRKLTDMPKDFRNELEKQLKEAFGDISFDDLVKDVAEPL